jgi:hypothetical protein
MDENERNKKAFDFAADLAKQMVTLSTGIVTLTLLFSHDIHALKRFWAVVAWCFYLLSTLCGLWTLMALTGTLASENAREQKGSLIPLGTNIRTPAKAQVVTFGLASMSTLIFVLTNFL